MQSSGEPSEARKDTRMNLPRETTNFYVQEYEDITLNTKLEKSRTQAKKVQETMILRPK